MKRPGQCKNGVHCPFSHDATVIAAALGVSVPQLESSAPTYKMTSGRPKGMKRPRALKNINYITKASFS